jgi:hypothetical protein
MSLGEGLLKKRINDEANITHSESAYEIETVNVYKVEEILDEAKKDLGIDKFIFSRKYAEGRLKRDKTLTQLETNYMELCVKLLKWFGDSS